MNRYLQTVVQSTFFLALKSLITPNRFWIVIWVIYLYPLSSLGQFNKQWDHHYGPVGYSRETALENITDNHGNVYAFGQSDQHGVILKYNNFGQLQWTFIVGRETERRAYPKDFKVDADGNCYALSKADNSDFISIIKINSEGKRVWNKGHNDVSHIFPTDNPKGKLLLDSEANIYVVFQSHGDLGVAKFSKDGDLLWNKLWSNPAEPDFLTDATLANNKIVVTGYSEVPTEGSYHPESLLLIYDSNGMFLWKDEFVQDLNLYSAGTFPVATDEANGILYVAYSARYGDGDVRNFLVRYTLTSGAALGTSYLFGDTPIKKLFVGSNNTLYTASDADFNISIRRFSLEGIPTGGVGLSDFASKRYYLRDVVFNKESNVMYALVKQDIFNGPVSYLLLGINQTAVNIISSLASNHGIIAGTSLSIAPAGQHVNVLGEFDNQVFYNDLLTMQINLSSGGTVWEKPYIPPNNLSQTPRAICYDAEGNSYVAGEFTSLVGPPPFWAAGLHYGVIKYNSSGEQIWHVKYAPEKGVGDNIYPTLARAIGVNSKQEVFVTGEVLGGSTELFSIKISADGQIISENILPGVPLTEAIGYNVVIDDKDNVYILLYRSNTENTGGKLILVKYNAQNQFMWEKEVTAQPIYYSGVGVSTGYSGRPKVKILNNGIYIGYNTYKYNGYISWEPVEITKMDMEGNRLFSKSIFECNDCNGEIHQRLLDFNVDANGVVYVLAGRGREEIIDFSGCLVQTAAMTSTDVLWQHSLPVNKFVSDGYLGLGKNNDVYAITSSAEKFTYSKFNLSTGDLLWSKSDPIYKYNTSGHPCFTYVKSDGNPVFMSTTATQFDLNNSDFFFSERNDVTGEQIFYEKYDGATDGFVSYQDQLLAFYATPSENSITVTGKISDKMSIGFGLAAVTIATARYSVTSLAADFTIDKSKITVGHSVVPTDQSTGNPEAWLWTFEGGTPAEYIGKNPPAIQYLAPGIYDVTLKVTKGDKSASRVIADCIEVLPKPLANFTYNKSKITAGSSVSFSDQSTGGPNSWEWTFEGGVPSTFTGKNPPPIQYAHAGSYAVALTVTRDDESDVLEIQDAIEVLEKLRANFTFEGDIIAGHETNFLNTSEGVANHWSWVFEGGSPQSSTLESASTTFASPGQYTIKLTVSNDIDSDSLTREVTVGAITGIENEMGEVVVYPNPTSGRFEFTSLRTITNLSLYNSLGKTVRSFDPSSQSGFDISEMPVGIYLLRFQAGEKVHVIKLVKR